MSRRVPELALVTGLLLGLPTFGYAVVFTGDVPLSTLTATAVFYPFAGYAVYHSADPTAVLPPRPVGGAGVVAGSLAGLSALLVTDPARLPGAALLGGFVGLVVALPALAYAVAYDRDAVPLPPRAALPAGGLLALGFLLLGVVAGDPLLASVNAGAVVLAGGLYAGEHGLRVTGGSGRRVVGAGFVVGLLLAAGGVLVGPLEVWVVEAVAVPLTVSLLYVVSLEAARERGRR